MNAYAFEPLDSQAFTGICATRILAGVTIGGNLKRLREAAGFTQNALGEAAKVKQSDVSKWEKGQVPTIRPLMRIAAALSVSVDELLQGVDPSYDTIVIAQRDLLRHAIGIQVASSLQPAQEGGATHGNSPSARELADELRSITDAFVGAVQDVADRLAGGMATAPTPHTAEKPRGHSSHRVRGHRKAG